MDDELSPFHQALGRASKMIREAGFFPEMQVLKDFASIRAHRLTDGKRIPAPGVTLRLYRNHPAWKWDETLDALAELLDEEK